MKRQRPTIRLLTQYISLLLLDYTLEEEKRERPLICREKIRILRLADIQYDQETAAKLYLGRAGASTPTGELASSRTCLSQSSSVLGLYRPLVSQCRESRSARTAHQVNTGYRL
jgi:hypothetical protein